MNKFEHTAAKYKRTRRPSWEHTIKTYQGNKKAGHNWFLIITMTLFLSVFGALALLIA